MAAATPFMPPAYRPRKPAVVTAASFGVLMFLSGLVITGIQLFYTIHYLKAVGAKTDVSLVAQLIPAWSRPFMVDLALVAPGLFGFTGACMAYSAWLLFNRNPDVAAVDTFPFPRRYRTYYVQHGLLGTVIGFVIGFANLDVRNDQAPIVMLAALSAALWSTLMAIALAYFFCPIGESISQKTLGAVDRHQVGADPLDALDRRAAQAAAALSRLSAAAGKADEALSAQVIADELFKLRSEVARTSQNLAFAERRIAALEKDMATSKDEVEQLRRTARNTTEAMSSVTSELAAMRKQTAERDARVQAELMSLQGRLDTFEKAHAHDQRERRAELSRAVKTGAALMERLRRSLED
jgi:uncharacterized coiled-coil protein SlyX